MPDSPKRQPKSPLPRLDRSAAFRSREAEAENAIPREAVYIAGGVMALLLVAIGVYFQNDPAVQPGDSLAASIDAIEYGEAGVIDHRVSAIDAVSLRPPRQQLPITGFSDEPAAARSPVPAIRESQPVASIPVSLQPPAEMQAPSGLPWRKLPGADDDEKQPRKKRRLAMPTTRSELRGGLSPTGGAAASTPDAISAVVSALEAAQSASGLSGGVPGAGRPGSPANDSSSGSNSSSESSGEEIVDLPDGPFDAGGSPIGPGDLFCPPGHGGDEAEPIDVDFAATDSQPEETDQPLPGDGDFGDEQSTSANGPMGEPILLPTF